MKARWQIEADADSVTEAACRVISRAAHSAITERGRFQLVLAGGSTPLAAYRRLALSQQRWKSWVLYYGDERCVPSDHPERNSRKVIETGLAHRVAKHHPIPTGLGPREAAAAYGRRLDRATPFDLVLLGMGDDGHTAGLFPGRDWPKQRVFVVKGAPKPPPKRVSLSPEMLQNCRQMLVLVTGAAKADTVGRWRKGEDLPVARVSDIIQATVITERDCLPLAGGQSISTGESLES